MEKLERVGRAAKGGEEQECVKNGLEGVGKPVKG